jgi:Flp pilus assembly protein TadD
MIPIVIVLILGFAIGLKAGDGAGGTSERLLAEYSGSHKAQLEEAYRSIIGGDYTQAAGIASVVRRNDPDNALAYFMLGLADAHRGLTDEAATNFEKASSLKPDFDLAWYNLGMVDESRSENSRALYAYRQAAGLNPDEARYSNAASRMGEIVLGEGGWDWQEAQSEKLLLSGFDAIHRGTPDDLGYAEDVFRSLLTERPYDVASRNMLGLALTRMGRFEEAERNFIDVVEREPGFAEAWYNLGMLHRSQGRLEEALAEFETAYSASSLESFRGATMREIREVRGLLESETELVQLSSDGGSGTGLSPNPE